MNTQNTNTNTTQTYDITKYYTRQKQNRYGNSYIITPKDTCPLDVLNDRDRFVVITFDRDDDYVVVAGRRYYLTRHNSIKATDHLQCRVAVVDLDALQHQKSYKYDQSFRHKYTTSFASFDSLRAMAREQFAQSGTPFVRQLAYYDKDRRQCSYQYQTSFDHGAGVGALA